MNYWLEHCEPPRARLPNVQWDVFLSYRSVDRVWTIALYDMLTQCGYRVFMDQFVLVAGKGLASQLGENMNQSASGVLIWSTRSGDSSWVNDELDAMIARQNATKGGAFPFYFVVASIDGAQPPALRAGHLYLDFAEYPDGPCGADLVRLTSGLQGKPLSPAAVGRVVAFERDTKEEPARLRSLAKVERFEQILEKVKSDVPAYTTSPTLLALAIDLLIRGKQYRRALEAVEVARSRFPGSLRIRQLEGLALRRDGQVDEAALRLTELKESGYHDTETLGILAAVWADVWEQRVAAGDAPGGRDALEQSRNLYLEGFAKVPSDTYVGINAASKSVLLGEVVLARELADKVLARLAEITSKNGGAPSSDYWVRVTEPEALLLKGEFDRSLALYHAARVAHQHEKGSIESTAKQVGRLLGVLEVPPKLREDLKREFSL